MLNKLYNFIEGEDIISLPEDLKSPIIEGMLYPKDYIIIIAEEKVGKTIISQQLACNLSNGKPFLGTFDVDSPQKVWYFATEGKTEDLRDRFMRMNQALHINLDNIKLIPTRFRFNTDIGRKCVEKMLKENRNRLPDVIILDPLYSAVSGSLKDDNVVNDFHHEMRLIQDHCGCAIILSHHLTKPSSDKNGKFFKTTDKSLYGSAFISAAVDHIFRLEKCKKNKMDRILFCDTQRSKNIPEMLRLRIIEPEPLYLTLISSHIEEKELVRKVLEDNEKLSVNQIMQKTKIIRSTVYVVLKELANENLISKTGTKTKYYSLKKDTKSDTQNQNQISGKPKVPDLSEVSL